MGRHRWPEEEMTLELIARSFGYAEDDDDEVLECGFSENEDGSGFVLLIQRTLYEPDEQDILLGFDTYCLVAGGRTHYGGIVRAEREGNLLRLDVSSKAARVLEVPANLEVHLEGSVDDVEDFFSGLPAILDWGREEGRPILVGF